MYSSVNSVCLQRTHCPYVLCQCIMAPLLSVRLRVVFSRRYLTACSLASCLSIPATARFCSSDRFSCTMVQLQRGHFSSIFEGFRHRLVLASELTAKTLATCRSITLFIALNNTRFLAFPNLASNWSYYCLSWAYVLQTIPIFTSLWITPKKAELYHLLQGLPTKTPSQTATKRSSCSN